MSKLTISEAAEQLGISKEAIYNRVRRGSLESVVEDGVKFVILESEQSSKPATRRVTTRKTIQIDDRYYKLLEDQNAKLQQKIEILEEEIRTLRDQKEQMLEDKINKIEQIYRDKDEQLKNTLNAISAKFMLNAPEDKQEVYQDLLEAEIEEESKENQDSRLISLNKYVKTKKFSKKKASKIKEKFKKRAKTDSRIITIGKKIYIDLEKYDYSDLSL